MADLKLMVISVTGVFLKKFSFPNNSNNAIIRFIETRRCQAEFSDNPKSRRTARTAYAAGNQQDITMNSFVKFLLIAICGYSLVTLAAWYFRNHLIFHPSSSIVATPKSLEMDYEEVRIKAPDGAEISGWYVPAHSGPLFSKGLAALLFHGNAGNMSGRLDYIRIFHELGLHSLIIDYRGYGRSGGKPSITGTEEDALAAWNWLITEKNISPHRIVLHGHSLGGGVAGWLAGWVRPAAVILEGTFPSLADAGQSAYPFLPVKLFMGDAYNTRENLRGVNVPVLVAHSREDRVIPYSLGRKLYDSYGGPKHFLELTGSHSGAFLLSGRDYVEGVKNFLLTVK